MLHNRKNRKKKVYFKYLGIIFVLFGLSLVSTAIFILFSPYVFSKPLVSPLPKGFKTQNFNIKELLTKEKIDVSKIEIAIDSSYMVSLKDGGKVIISSRKDIPSQVRSLQIILSRLTIEGKRFKTLDFRFDKPVVAF